MGSGASANSKLPEKIPEMPSEPPNPNARDHVSLHRSRSGITDTDLNASPAVNSKGKRRSSVTSASTANKETFDLEKLKAKEVNKMLSEETKKQIVESIQHFFFPPTSEADSNSEVSHENTEQVELFIKALVRETSPKDSYPMKEGETGTKLYILEKGEVEVTIEGNFIRNMGPGSLFGELALIYDAPRSASIRCTNDCVFWCLSRANYQGILNMTRAQDVTQLRSVRLMECPEIGGELGYVGRSRLLRELETRKFEKGDIICEQGSVSDIVLMVEVGKAIATRGEGDGDGKIVYKDLQLNSPEVPNEDDSVSSSLPLTPGCVFGIPILEGLRKGKSSGLWEYNKEESNFRCPVKIVAEEATQCAVFKASFFESLRGLECDENEKTSTRRVVGDALFNEENFGVIENFDINNLKLHLITSQGSRSAHALGTYCGKAYSIKYVSKANIISKTSKEINELLNESDMLSNFHCRFIQKMCCVYETPTAIAFVTEDLDRGDLFSAIYENPMFPANDGGIPPSLIKFYISNIASGVSYLHKKSIAYRDLKPENCLIDSNGYIKITDFTYAKKIPFFSKDRWGRKILQVRSTTICGTPEYMAPEFILCIGNDHGVDLWSLGILLYEMIQLITPFAVEGDNNVQELFKRITRIKLIASDILYLDDSIDEKMEKSPSARRLIESLLKGNADKRLGYEDGHQVLEHEFFHGFPVHDVVLGSYEPPYIPAPMMLTGTDVGDTPDEFPDPSSFFDSMNSKETKRFNELFKDKKNIVRTF